MAATRPFLRSVITSPQAYHSELNNENVRVVGRMAILPLKTNVKGPAPPGQPGALALLWPSVMRQPPSRIPSARLLHPLLPPCAIVRDQTTFEGTARCPVSSPSVRNGRPLAFLPCCPFLVTYLVIDKMDIVDEALDYFKANVLFRNFDVKGPGA